jgi:hypothetical protein
VPTHKWKDVRAKNRSPEELADIDREVARELAGLAAAESTPSRAEQVAVATLEAIAAADRRSKGGPCAICRCPQHAGHKADCPVGLAVRALETIANLKAMGA